MKKIFVSIPCTDHMAELPARCIAAHEKYDALNVKVFTPKDVVPDSSTPYATCLGKTIEKVLEVDEVVFANGWAYSKGCTMEMHAAQTYGKKWFVDVKI